MNHIIEQYSQIISDYEIIDWESEPTAYRFKARIVFTDGSFLAIKDYLISESRKYAYHWQNKEGNRIIRWDNAPHWKNIDTYPHHRHENSEIFSSTEVTLEDVLNKINHIIQSEAGKTDEIQI